MKTARVQVRGQVAKGLRSVAAAVQQQDGWRTGALEHESLTANYDTVRPKTPVCERQCGHVAHVLGAPSPNGRQQDSSQCTCGNSGDHQ
jgi:hypothetical protein